MRLLCAESDHIQHHLMTTESAPSSPTGRSSLDFHVSLLHLEMSGVETGIFCLQNKGSTTAIWRLSDIPFRHVMKHLHNVFQVGENNPNLE